MTFLIFNFMAIFIASIRVSFSVLLFVHGKLSLKEYGIGTPCSVMNTTPIPQIFYIEIHKNILSYPILI